MVLSRPQIKFIKNWLASSEGSHEKLSRNWVAKSNFDQHSLNSTAKQLPSPTANSALVREDRVVEKKVNLQHPFSLFRQHEYRVVKRSVVAVLSC